MWKESFNNLFKSKIQTADEYIEKANRKLMCGKFVEAEKLYCYALQYNPNNALCWSYRSRCLEEMKRYAESLEGCLKSIELNPQVSEFTYLRILQLYVLFGEIEKANETIEEFQKRFPQKTLNVLQEDILILRKLEALEVEIKEKLNQMNFIVCLQLIDKANEIAHQCSRFNDIKKGILEKLEQNQLSNIRLSIHGISLEEEDALRSNSKSEKEVEEQIADVSQLEIEIEKSDTDGDAPEIDSKTIEAPNNEDFLSEIKEAGQLQEESSVSSGSSDEIITPECAKEEANEESEKNASSKPTIFATISQKRSRDSEDESDKLEPKQRSKKFKKEMTESASQNQLIGQTSSKRRLHSTSIDDDDEPLKKRIKNFTFNVISDSETTMKVYVECNSKPKD